MGRIRGSFLLFFSLQSREVIWQPGQTRCDISQHSLVEARFGPLGVFYGIFPFFFFFNIKFSSEIDRNAKIDQNVGNFFSGGYFGLDH